MLKLVGVYIEVQCNSLKSGELYRGDCSSGQTNSALALLTSTPSFPPVCTLCIRALTLRDGFQNRDI
jgi:hypothetical protein